MPAWISNYIYHKVWDEIIPKHSMAELLKFFNGWVTLSHTLLGIWLLSFNMTIVYMGKIKPLLD